MFKTNWLKTIRINLNYFPLKQAAKLPILVSYRVVFKTLRGGVEIKAPIATGMLQLGYQILGNIDSKYERTIWEVNGRIIIAGKHICIGRGNRLSISGECTFGDNVNITGKSTIICHDSIQFGNNDLISWDVLIMDTDYHDIYNNKGEIINKESGIIIDDNVWIGCRSAILKGSYVAANNIIAAGSIVSGTLNKQDCVYSSDRKILKERVTWSM